MSVVGTFWECISFCELSSEMEIKTDKSLFEGVHFYIYDKNVERASEVKAAMKEGGATREFYLNDLVTHIVSDEAIEANILSLWDCHALHSDWVMLSVKCGAQLPTKAFDLSKPRLFSGLTFTTSKLPRADVEKIAVLVFYYGGQYQTTLDSNITHLITMKTGGDKYNCAISHCDVVKVVTPDWLLDCIDLGTRLDEADYKPFKASNGETCQTSEAGAMIVTSSTVQTVSRDTVMNGAPQSNTSPLTPSTPLTHPTCITASHTTCAVNEQEQIKSTAADEPQTEQTGGSDQLLNGVSVCLCDYQECMDPDTVEKWKQVVKQHGGGVVDSPEHCTHLLALHKKSLVFARAFAAGKCIASAHWLNDVLTEQKMFPPRNALHFPTAFKWQLLGADKYSMTLSNYTESERELVKDMIRICGISCTGHLDKNTTHLICKRSEGKKYDKAQEWGVPVVNSSFLADIIHNGTVPAVLFPRYTRLGQSDEFTPGSCFEATSILKPWETFMANYSKLHPELVDQHTTLHSLTPLTPSQATPTSNIGKHERTHGTPVEETEAKKQKLETDSGPQPPIVLVTGISQSVAKTLKNSVLQLGGVVTERGNNCTHIVLPRVTRTVKFLCGLSVCQHVVTPQWVESSVRKGRFLPEDPFRLEDKDAQEMFGMDIGTSLARARERKLLKGLCLHATPGVQPPASALKDIVHSAGGELLSLPELKAQCGGRLDQISPDHTIVVSTPEEVAAGHCNEFFNAGMSVYNAELVLTGILRQELDFTLNKLSPP